MHAPANRSPPPPVHHRRTSVRPTARRRPRSGHRARRWRPAATAPHPAPAVQPPAGRTSRCRLRRPSATPPCRPADCRRSTAGWQPPCRSHFHPPACIGPAGAAIARRTAQAWLQARTLQPSWPPSRPCGWQWRRPRPALAALPGWPCRPRCRPQGHPCDTGGEVHLGHLLFHRGLYHRDLCFGRCIAAGGLVSLAIAIGQALAQKWNPFGTGRFQRRQAQLMMMPVKAALGICQAAAWRVLDRGRHAAGWIRR